MADGVNVPGVGDFATDQVDIIGQGSKHAQYVKMADGRNGGTTPLSVMGNGGMLVGSQLTKITTLHAAASATYAEGEMIGAPVVVSGVAAGLYRVHSYSLITPVSHVAFEQYGPFWAATAVEDPTPAAMPGDGDAVDFPQLLDDLPDAFGGFLPNVFIASAYGSLNGERSYVPAYPNRVWIGDGTSATVDLHVGLNAYNDQPNDMTANGIKCAMVLELLIRSAEIINHGGA